MREWNRQIWKKKNKATIECDKRTVKYDIGAAQYKDWTVKCEEKKKRKGNHQICRGGVKGCSGGSNESLDLKIKILYIKKYFFLAYFTLKKKKKFAHFDLNFAHPNHR